jgi:hypothetical protein
VVAEQPAREAGQDRCQARRSWPLRYIPNAARDFAADVRGYPDADRPLASTARTSMKDAAIRMRQTTLVGCALMNADQRVAVPRRSQSPASGRLRRGRCTIAVGKEAKRATLILNPLGFGATSVKRYCVFERSYFRVKSEFGSNIRDRLCRFRATGPPGEPSLKAGQGTAADAVRT